MIEAVLAISIANLVLGLVAVYQRWQTHQLHAEKERKKAMRREKREKLTRKELGAITSDKPVTSKIKNRKADENARNRGR
jgi:hypothetical protein